MLNELSIGYSINLKGNVKNTLTNGHLYGKFNTGD